MIEQELILLGLLKDSPKHGYEIKKEIKGILSVFAGVDVESIYYPLRILEQQKLVQKRTARSGRRPQRYVYALTPQGEARFQELLERSFLDFRRPQFSLDLSLFFLNHMQPQVAKRRLRARQRMLQRISRGLQQFIGSINSKRSSSLERILEHNLRLLESESNFLEKLTSSL